MGLLFLLIHRVWKNSTPKRLEVMGGTETTIYCQASICQTCVLAVPLTIKVGLSKVGNQEKGLKHSEQVVFVANLEQIFQRTATDINTKLTMTQQILMCALKNDRFLPDGSCCLKDMGKNILFRINWRWVNQGFYVAP
jgi:hypothetical protein